MKTIIYNYDKLENNDINEVVKRARGFIINNNNEVLMSYCNGMSHYEFPGGHVEENESVNDCLKREIKEETGIDVETNNLEPFMVIKYYSKNYKNTNKNRLTEFYYYEVKTNDKFDLSNTNFDAGERELKYECRYVPLKDLESTIKENMKTTLEKNTSLNDVLKVIEEYNETNNN